MDKASYINELYDNIKDNIEFDSDVIALEKILIAMLNLDVLKSIEKWIYIINKSYLNDLSKDVDLNPLIKKFPLEIIKKISFVKFIDIVEGLDNNKDLVYNALFDVFEDDCGIFEIITDFINKDLKNKEREIIYLIIEKSRIYSQTVFDIMQFLKKIIAIHLKQKNKNISLLLEYTKIPKSIKDQSVLKSLLIDYI